MVCLLFLCLLCPGFRGCFFSPHPPFRGIGETGDFPIVLFYCIKCFIFASVCTCIFFLSITKQYIGEPPCEGRLFIVVDILMSYKGIDLLEFTFYLCG